MTSDEHLERIATSDAYREFVRRRGRFETTLAVIMTVAWLGFLLLVAFDKSLLARAIGGGATTLGVPLGLGLILLAWFLTALYVRRANQQFDTQIAAIRLENGA